MNLNNIAIVAVGRALGHGWAYEIDRADGRREADLRLRTVRTRGDNPAG